MKWFEFISKAKLNPSIEEVGKCPNKKFSPKIQDCRKLNIINEPILIF